MSSSFQGLQNYDNSAIELLFDARTVRWQIYEQSSRATATVPS